MFFHITPKKRHCFTNIFRFSYFIVLPLRRGLLFLKFINIPIDYVSEQQFFMGTHIVDFSVFKYYDKVGIFMELTRWVITILVVYFRFSAIPLYILLL